jgi:predicted membrane metal-binding protein
MSFSSFILFLQKFTFQCQTTVKIFIIYFYFYLLRFSAGTIKQSLACWSGWSVRANKRRRSSNSTTISPLDLAVAQYVAEHCSTYTEIYRPAVRRQALRQTDNPRAESMPEDTHTAMRIPHAPYVAGSR